MKFIILLKFNRILIKTLKIYKMNSNKNIIKIEIQNKIKNYKIKIIIYKLSMILNNKTYNKII